VSLTKSFLRKPAAFIALAVALLMSVAMAAPAAAVSTSDYNKQVAAQQALISDLQSKLDAANQQLTDLQNNSNGQADLINAAQTEATQAQDALDAAAADYASQQALYDADFTAEQAAEQAVNDAIAAVNTASDNVDSTYAAYQSAQSNTDAAQAAVQTAQTNYDTQLIAGNNKATAGLTVDVYTGISSRGNPPKRDDATYTKCKTVTVSNIQANWGGGDILGCGSDYIMLHYHGYITYPTSSKVYFQNQADDGFYMSIGGQQVINDWALKGCGANSVGLYSFTGGQSYSVDAWYYEWTGGACSTLFYQQLGQGGWSVAPASMFSQQALTPTQHDPALKVILDAKTAAYVAAVAAEESAQTTYLAAGDTYDAATQAYDAANQTLIAKQATLASDDGTVSASAATWQTAADNKAVKDAALATLKTQYQSTFDALNAQAQVVDGLETKLAQAKAALAAIPKPTSPAKSAKKVTTKPAPPTKVTPRDKFVPAPKR